MMPIVSTFGSYADIRSVIGIGQYRKSNQLIGTSAKSHIGASLVNTLQMNFRSM